jgi:RNA polymerase I-specific transcription initiation factor RRN5
MTRSHAARTRSCWTCSMTQGQPLEAPLKSRDCLPATAFLPSSNQHGRVRPANTTPPRVLAGAACNWRCAATAAIATTTVTMSSGSGDESVQDYTDEHDSPQRSRISSRQQSNTPDTPRKRRRIESVDLEPSRVRQYYLEGKYNDAYRVLFNQEVTRVAARFTPTEGSQHQDQHYTTQYGASTWSGEEQATLFAALGRLGKDHVAGIAEAIGTKSIPETHELLLLLRDAATTKGSLGLTMRDIPAAIEVGRECTEELDVMAEALAWYQEQWEVTEEQNRYGDYWLVTPRIAQDIEVAINGSSRAVSIQSATPAEPEPEPEPEPEEQAVDVDNGSPAAAHDQLQPQILQAMPEADLLHAENFLLLSRDLFMNRSPDIPSPWPHWSAYASEQVSEPSIMRTCFNDFHALAVSVTKRLMQTAIFQATSRLRSQRHRSKKRVVPLVKTGDVLSAIDVLGMKRNGHSRWTGVARRCNVRVIDEQRTTRFKVEQREISWDQAEQILGLYDAVTTHSCVPSAAPATDSEGEGNFRQRAARHGTPLPMEKLSLSKSESDLEATVDTGDDADESDTGGTDEESQDSVKEDATDRSSSVDPEDAAQIDAHERQTVEQFDQEARRQEEEALSTRLGFAVTVKSEAPDDLLLEHDSDGASDALISTADDWRDWTEYRAAWEEYPTAVPLSKFVANQKPRAQSYTVGAAVDSDSSTGSRSAQKSAKTGSSAVELDSQNPRKYAAMRSDAYGASISAPTSDSSDADSAEADMPAQSIEHVGTERDSGGYNVMDWEA